MKVGVELGLFKKIVAGSPTTLDELAEKASADSMLVGWCNTRHVLELSHFLPLLCSALEVDRLLLMNRSNSPTFVRDGICGRGQSRSIFPQHHDAYPYKSQVRSYSKLPVS